MKTKYLFHTDRDSRKHMYNELLADGWRYNLDGEIKNYIGGFILLKEFKSEDEIRTYFKTKYPKFTHGCTCDECSGDYHWEEWSEILHTPKPKL